MKTFHGSSMFLCIAIAAVLGLSNAWASDCDQETLQTRNINLLPPGPVLRPGLEDPKLNNLNQPGGSASSTPEGVSFTLNRWVPNELEFFARYTKSNNFSNTSDLHGQPQNPFNLLAERPLTPENRRDHLQSNAIWEMPTGIEKGDTQPQHRGLLTRIFSHIVVGATQTSPLRNASLLGH